MTVYCTFGDETLSMRNEETLNDLYTQYTHVKNILWQVFRSTLMAYPE